MGETFSGFNCLSGTVINDSYAGRFNGLTYHKTTYWEWEIPWKLESKLTRIVQKELKAFSSKCKCGYCKLKRETKKRKK